MAASPKPLALRAEDLGDVPEWGRAMMERLNEFSAQVSECMSKGVTRGENLSATDKIDLVFTTQSTPANTFPIRISHGLANGVAKHVDCTKLERVDGTAISSAWSMTWGNTSEGMVNVTFQGLTGSVKYRANFTFE